jgi:DNA-binding response OmpR family regulator
MKSRILVIDDNEPLRNSLARLLTRKGYEVIEAANGRIGLHCMSECQADLVVTDMMMPEMGGVETILALRRSYPGVKIIALSGAEPYVKIARAVGSHKAMRKPLELDEFLDAVRELAATE